MLAVRGVGAKSLEKESVPVGEGVVGNVVKTGETVVLNDVEAKASDYGYYGKYYEMKPVSEKETKKRA